MADNPLICSGYQTVGHITIETTAGTSYYSPLGYLQPQLGIRAQQEAQSFAHLIQAIQQPQEPKLTGNKPIVICGGKSTECKDLDEAQTVAEREAHAQSTDAYILKPVRKVAPKRDVVTTDLP